jgi:site-specific DNA recombinase
MGGNVPLGYDESERTLVISPAEAGTVRRIFALYLDLGCVRRVTEEADRLGLRTKRSTTASGTERSGNKPFSRGHILQTALKPDLRRSKGVKSGRCAVSLGTSAKAADPGCSESPTR